MSLWQLERQTDAWDGWTAVSTLPDCWSQSNIIAECQHYCLLPWWSSLWEHLTHMPLPIPSSFSMHQKQPLSSDIPNTFLLFLLYMRPSGYDCFIVGGSENAKAPTKNWNQTPKTYQSSFNVRTTNQLWGTCTSSHFPVSCITDDSEALPQKSMSFKEKERNKIS